MAGLKRSDIEKKIDVIEDDIVAINPELLNILLKDKTTRKNILWCTADYKSLGILYDEHSEIKSELITGEFSNVIQPRAAKMKSIQEKRIKDRAEVFTPSWICNKLNNQIDEAWFGRKNVFNIPQGNYWITNSQKIMFPDNKRNWKSYVDAKRLEITCGEAPYLVSRYDTTTGELLPVYKRIGLFDRKMRIVNENCDDKESWIKWSIRAIKSVYGYEFQGDSLLIARENLLYDYIDYYNERFKKDAPLNLLKEISNIIAWNIWQMDGLRFVVPYSCHEIKETNYQMTLFDMFSEEEKNVPCPGCEKNDAFEHTGIYCRIYDWTNLKKSIRFIDIFKESVTNG